MMLVSSYLTSCIPHRASTKDTLTWGLFAVAVVVLACAAPALAVSCGNHLCGSREVPLAIRDRERRNPACSSERYSTSETRICQRAIMRGAWRAFDMERTRTTIHPFRAIRNLQAASRNTHASFNTGHSSNNLAQLRAISTLCSFIANMGMGRIQSAVWLEACASGVD